MKLLVKLVLISAVHQVIHPIEECPETLAFVSEPVIASLANVLAAQEQRHAIATAQSGQTPAGAMNNHHHHHHYNQQGQPGQSKPTFATDYEMLEIEVKYGLLQCTEGLSHLHYNRQILHRNVCPSSVIITKKGTWKLFGFEFIGLWVTNSLHAEFNTFHRANQIEHTQL